MSMSLTFPFTDAGDYAFNAALVEVAGGVGKLKLQADAGLTFAQDFASSAGFTFDAALTEFVGGVVRQNDTRPDGAKFYIPYSADIHGAWGEGSLTGTPTGSPAIAGGKLDLTGYVNKFVAYAAAGNADGALQQGCIRFRVTPNYSGTPTARQNIFAIGNAANVKSSLTVYHDSATGYLYISIYNSAGVAIYSSYIQAGLYWVPVAGTEYEFELNYDLDNPTSIRLFINGTLWGVAVSGIGTRATGDITTIWIGTLRGGIPAASTNFKIRNVLFFDSVQHTANYTPSWATVYDTIYRGDVVSLPLFTYTGPGDIQAYTALALTEANAPRYTVNDKWHNGAAWVASTNVWAEANTAAQVIANIGTLTLSDTVQVKIITNNGAAQMNVGDLLLTYTGQIYPLTDPTIEGNASWENEGIDGFAETKVAAGADQVKYILKKGTSWYWWNGVAWAVSNETYAQASTAADIEANKSAFTAAPVTSKFRAFLHSGTGVTTPQLDTLVVSYNYSGETADEIHRTILWGYRVPGDRTPIKITPSFDNVKYKLHTRLSKTTLSHVITDFRENGYWEIEIIDTANMAGTQYYTVDFGNGVKKSIQVAAVATLAIEDVL